MDIYIKRWSPSPPPPSLIPIPSPFFTDQHQVWSVSFQFTSKTFTYVCESISNIKCWTVSRKLIEFKFTKSLYYMHPSPTFPLNIFQVFPSTCGFDLLHFYRCVIFHKIFELFPVSSYYKLSHRETPGISWAYRQLQLIHIFEFVTRNVFLLSRS